MVRGITSVLNVDLSVGVRLEVHAYDDLLQFYAVDFLRMNQDLMQISDETSFHHENHARELILKLPKHAKDGAPSITGLALISKTMFSSFTLGAAN